MKFAYLIMAHDNAEQLSILLNVLDQPENDIFLHIDRKADMTDFESIGNKLRYAKIHIYRRYKVYWADISQTKCQTFLLSEAVKEYHNYYHLLSNADLPIRDHKTILNFFSENEGKEFVHFESGLTCKKRACRYYHILFPLIQRIKSGKIEQILSSVERKFIHLQEKRNVDRQLYCGANWYSITHDLAVDFISHKMKCSERFVLLSVRMNIFYKHF